ncbi:diguanylate cyclase domain-containing protein [Azospirillum halopraeferens]|uniref:diguanylate cyclase domain-containing protein n=1 Tax=Azospirillum halopraeferens TaxID=34010 RepID=UPI0003F7501B|nr:diguanylate cyclase [Azospirillum halopraeferens]
MSRGGWGGGNIAQAVAVALAALTALLASSLWSSREAALEMAELALHHEARVHGQQISGVLALVDFGLRELAEHLGDASGEPDVLLSAATLETLARRHLASSHTVSLLVYDAGGATVALAGRRQPGLENVSGRDFFRRHRDQLATFQYETAAQMGHEGRALVGLSRAVVAGGGFAGMVLAVVDVERLYAPLSSPAIGVTAEAARLTDAQGTVLATWPQPSDAAADDAGPGPFAAAADRPATPPWIVVVHQLSDFPFRLAAAVRRDTALANWWHEAWLLATTLGASAALLLAMVGVLVLHARHRRVAEDGLRDELAFRNALLDTIPLPIYWKDTELRYLGCNAAFEELVRCRSGELSGRSTDSLFLPADAAAHEAADRRVLEGGGALSYEQPTRFPDGTERVIIASKAVFARADGTPGGVVGILVDITERRRAEERTAALLKALEHSPSSIVITDPEGRITYVNPTFTATTGYTADEAKGQNPRFLQSGETPPDTYRGLWEALTAGRVWHGEFRNRRKNGEVYWERAAIAPILGQDGRTVSFVAVKDDINAEKLAAERVWQQAHLDALTGLANRNTLRDRLARAMDGARHSRGRLALLYIDLDRFKPVNDTFGHEAGDELLVQVAARLRTTVRDDDTVARLGGDEFVVLMAIREETEAVSVATRILTAMARPFELEFGTVEIGASIGASVFPVDATDADTLIRHADAAMYEAKQAGRATVRFYARCESPMPLPPVASVSPDRG